MKRFAKAVTSLAWYAAILTAAYLASVEGAEWAANVVRFYAWVALGIASFFVTVILVSLASDTPMPARPPRALPGWAGWLLSLAFAFMLAASGWFISAAAYLLACGISEVGLAAIPNTRTPEPASVETT